MPKTNTTRSDDALRRVWAILEKAPLIDGHNDLPMVIRADPVARGDIARFRLDEEHGSGDTDIPRLRRGGVSGQIWAAFTPSESKHPALWTLEQIDLILRMQEAFPDIFVSALDADDVLRAKREGKIASIVAVEGAIGLENSLAPLRVWFAAGVRLVTLCHNGTLDWVDSATDLPRSGGLSPFGRDVVRELNRLGMMVDCAHVSTDVMHQVLDISTAPIVFSHSNARALCQHPRNVPDDVLARLPANDGLIMATFVPHFVSEETRRWITPLRRQASVTLGADWTDRLRAYEAEHGPAPAATLEQVADHICYLADKVGAHRLGIGSDFWGGPDNPAGLEDVSRFPYLLAEMVMRGWSDDHVAGLAGLNFLRVFRAVDHEGQRLRSLARRGKGAPGEMAAAPAG